ncbi:MAG: AAA family ATPase [Ignavibacteria bacterium]|nr:AAA family ATPase [Ignavibacteria bacterium]
MKIIGRTHLASRIDESVAQWRKGKGDVLFITGEPGSGKSYVLSAVQETFGGSVGEHSIVRVDCRPPIGSFNVSAIQPLQPFGYALEQVFLNTERAARKRLAVNIGMSVLASIPIAGDIFYAIKAISQDVTEFRKETAALQQKKRAAVDDCITTLRRVAAQTPLILLIDDGHWSDAQSVEVVKRLLEEPSAQPILLIWCVTPSVANRSNLQLASLLQHTNAAARTLHLDTINIDDVAKIIELHAPYLKPTDKQVQMLHERSAGIPGVLVEYIRYFERTNQIGKDGVIPDTALSESGVKLSDHPYTDFTLHEISEQDAITLSLCAAEGREFTAFLASSLMNTDVLSAVRTLRRIQMQTGCVKSVGMRTRYGLKTTTYEFTTSVAFLHFLHYPEYEERKHIHQRIVEILSREHNAASVDEIRFQIAAFIAAHSSEAENEATMNAMLESAAVGAEMIGAFDTSDFIRAELLIKTVSSETVDLSEEPAAPESTSSERHQMAVIILGSACEHLLNNEPQSARRLALDVLQRKTLTSHERIIARCIAARACIAMQAMKDAEALLDEAGVESVRSADDKVMLLNVRAVLALANNDEQKGRALLTEATRITHDRKSPARLLTMINIVTMMRNERDDNVGRFEHAVQTMVRDFGWSPL